MLSKNKEGIRLLGKSTKRGRWGPSKKHSSSTTPPPNKKSRALATKATLQSRCAHFTNLLICSSARLLIRWSVPPIIYSTAGFLFPPRPRSPNRLLRRKGGIGVCKESASWSKGFQVISWKMPLIFLPLNCLSLYETPCDLPTPSIRNGPRQRACSFSVSF